MSTRFVFSSSWLVLITLSCGTSKPLEADHSTTVRDEGAQSCPEPAETRVQVLLEEARSARGSGDHVRARMRITQAIELALGDWAQDRTDAWCTLLEELGDEAQFSGDLRNAERVRTRLVDILSATRPGEDVALQVARGRLASTLCMQGEFDSARRLQEQALEVLTRVLPGDHRSIQWIRRDLAVTMKSRGDLRTARSLEEQVVEVLSRTLPQDHMELQAARLNLGGTCLASGDLTKARELFEGVVEVFTRTLPDEHLALQMARGNLAATIKRLGDLHGALVLEERVLEVRSHALPDDHPDLQLARGNLAMTLGQLGDLARARPLQEKVLEVCARTLPADDPSLQRARLNLATTLETLGETRAAYDFLEQVHEVFSRTLPEDHPDLLLVRGNLAVMVQELGDARRACEMLEQVLEAGERTLPDDHYDLRRNRLNLAGALKALGDLPRAQSLEEQVLEVGLRTLQDDHPDLQTARGNLAATLFILGDLRRARALQERVLSNYSRSLPADHPHLQEARGNLALTLIGLGDLHEARSLFEQVLEVYSRTLPADHRRVQWARQGLSHTLRQSGEPQEARILQEQALEACSRTLPDDHPQLQIARGNLAATLRVLGEPDRARELLERVLEVFSRTLPEDHPHLQVVRGHLAMTALALGDLSGAERQLENVFRGFSETLPSSDPAVQLARSELARALCMRLARAKPGTGEIAGLEEERQEAAELVTTTFEVQTDSARKALAESSVREAQMRCEVLAGSLDMPFSLVPLLEDSEPRGRVDRASFAFREVTRCAALGAATLMRRAASAPEYEGLKSMLRDHGRELARLAAQGTTSNSFRAAMQRRDELQRDLIQLAKDLSDGTPPGLDFDVDSLASRLDQRTAVISFHRYMRTDPAAPLLEPPVPCLRGYVLRCPGPGSSDPNTARLMRVELGPMAPIEGAVHAWRESMGIGIDPRGTPPGSGVRTSKARTDSEGEVVRRLVLDPVLLCLDEEDHVILVLDDILHLVSFDALPTANSAESQGAQTRLGDCFTIETRVTVGELLAPVPRRPSGRGLVAIGGVDFGVVDSGRVGDAEFLPLPGTADEAHAIVQCLHAGAEEQPWTLLEGTAATRERFMEATPQARWIHVATHGWFSTDAVRSWEDTSSFDGSLGLVNRLPAEAEIRRASPMLLCGLALAGANLPEDELGRTRGRMTAEEISVLDLSGCEMVVLSACDTNLGIRNAGQGVASFQMALQMAGARSVITSLWKVPDGATRELMVEFYRLLWVEEKAKHEALWEAKRALRDARDDQGRAKYALPDWAAWVLTGEPD